MKLCKPKTIRFKYFTTLLLLLSIFFANGQTDPTPQNLPFLQDFSALAHSSTTFPNGFQGWRLGTNSPGTNFRITPAITDVTLTGNSGANSVSATQVHNYNGKIGFLHSGASECSIVLALNTSGLNDIQLNYDVMTIRNPYDGASNTRISESIIQYRVGTTGNFTNITSVAYQTNTTTQTASGVTTPQNLLARSVVLPSDCNNQAVVQVRWVSRDTSGAGSRPSIAIDNINVTSIGAAINTTGTLSALSTSYGTASSETSFNVSANNLTADLTVTPPAGFEISTSQFSGYGSSLTLTQTSGAVTSTTVFVRLASTTNVGVYSGNISLSDGTTSATISTASSTVNPIELTISGISIADKTFNGDTAATIDGTPTLNGVINAEDVTLSGTPVASFDDPAVGNNKPVSITGYTISGTAIGNYSLTQPTGLTGNILPSGLLDQTITFNPLTSVTYGDSSFTLTATSDSTLPVSYSSSNTNVATILGDVVTIVGAGTTTITATQAGDTNYNPALPVNQDLVVNTKELTLTDNSVTDKFYDGTTVATLSGTVNGVINSDDVTVNFVANFDDAFVGTNKNVTSTSTLTGANASNYFLTQPTGLTGSILAVACSGYTGTINWNFTDGTANASNTNAGVTVSALSSGNTNGTANFITSAATSTGYAGASGTFNASLPTFIGALNTSTSTYYEFTITPQAGYVYTLSSFSFGSRSTGSGPQLYSLKSSLDNYTSDITSGTLPNNSTWNLYTNSIAVSANTSVTFRIYGSNGTGTPNAGVSNWRIDDISLNISSSPDSALSSETSLTICNGDNFNYTATTNYTGATVTWTRNAVEGISNEAVSTPQTGVIDELLVNTTSLPIEVTYSFTVTTSTCFVTQDVIVSVNPIATYYLDADNDGYYTGESIIDCINPGEGYVTIVIGDGDCDDNNPLINPGATEVCYDGIDNDCDGTIDNGCTPIVSVIQTAQCGITLPAINSYVYANVVAGAQGYRFRVTDMSTMAVQTIDKVLRVFQITQLANYKFDTTYQVEVSVRINNVWQPFYGTPCTVTTPATTTQIQSAQCGSTITAMTDVVYANLVSFATGYRFRVTNVLTSDVQILDRALREFRMSQLSSPEYNALYSVEVAVRNTDGTYLPYGAVCNITTPAFPTTSLQNSQCDYTAASMSETVYAISYPGATTYRFKFENTGLMYSYTFDKPLRTFNLNEVPGLLPATTYNVQVSIELDGVFGPYGKVCTLTTPGMPARTIEKVDSIFNVMAYPNPYDNTFMLDVKSSNDENINVKVYDMIGKQIDNQTINAGDIKTLQIGNNYTSGVYNVIVTQGNQSQNVRVIKR